MDDASLTRLLRLVDDPAPEPAEFKKSLRARLDETLERATPPDQGSATAPVDVLVDLPESPEHRPRRRTRPLLAAAAVVILIATAGLALGLLEPGPGETDVTQPAVSPPTQPPPPPTTPTIESACAAYAATAPRFEDLDRFADPDAAADGPPDRTTIDSADLTAASEALETLRGALVDGDLADPQGIRSLQIAAGAIGQAAIELTAGDDSAAAQSVGFALDEIRSLRDAPDVTVLPGCGFP